MEDDYSYDEVVDMLDAQEEAIRRETVGDKVYYTLLVLAVTTVVLLILLGVKA